MSFNPARRRAVLGHAAPDHDHSGSADHHDGSRQTFLRRHGREARQAALGNTPARQEFAEGLLSRAGDSKNVYSAIKHCKAQGQAAGPDGVRPADLQLLQMSEMASSLGQAIRNSSFHPGRARTERISKGGSRGYRTIHVQNFDDRVVERSLLQIIRPFSDATLRRHEGDDLRYASIVNGRPTEEMLALLERMMIDMDRWVLMSVDVRNAFDNVPRTRLSSALRHILGSPDVVSFLEKVTSPQIARARKGIRQGGPLSPWLLDTYFSHCLRQWWISHFPGVPLLWYVDDFLALTQDLEEAKRVYTALSAKIREIGLSVKESETDAICDLQHGGRTNWLGYQLELQENSLRLRLSEKSWDKLSDNLAMAYDEPAPAVSAYQSINGWINAKGPAYGNQSMEDVCTRIVTCADEHGFSELPSQQSLETTWRRAHLRDWVQLRRETIVRDSVRLRAAEQHRADPERRSAVSFASQQSIYATLRREHTLNVQTEPLLRRRDLREVQLYCDGSCLGQTRIGGWAYSLKSGDQLDAEQSGSHPRTTNNRMEMSAVLYGLRACPTNVRVLVVVDSQYVERTVTKNLINWLDRGWFSLRSKTNARLWHKIARELELRYVECRWVRGHSGHPENEHVDQLARAAAEQLQQQIGTEAILPPEGDS